MSEATLICPNCKTEIKLTESLAAPLLEATRKEFEDKLADQNTDILKREGLLKKASNDLTSTVEAKVANQLNEERTKLISDAKEGARKLVASELKHGELELANLQEALDDKDAKLEAAQNKQAQLIIKERELSDSKRELELTVATRISEGLEDVRQKAKQEAEGEQKLKVMEKEQTIAAMTKTIDELKRKSEQGSQQLQGEVFELDFEKLLAEKFPLDNIEPVPKGEFGGDVLQRVSNTSGGITGTIIWELKRTKNWSEAWLTKLRGDQRAAKAEVAIIVSHALPNGVETFDRIDGVWVVHPRAALPIAIALRQTILDVAIAKQSKEGQQTKMEMVYHYLTGSDFRLRVEAIVEAFTTMQEDLNKERKVITKQWAKRDQQITRVLETTVGMYGDLQGIAGKSLAEIEGLDIECLTVDSEA